jgi:hypothetical protein
MTKSIGSASDGNHLPLHLKLLHNIWWRVRERPGEAWPDSRTIFEGHRHLGVVILVLWKCSGRGSHIWGLILFIMSPTWNRRNLTDPLSVQCWPRCVVWSHVRSYDIILLGSSLIRNLRSFIKDCLTMRFKTCKSKKVLHTAGSDVVRGRWGA